MCRVPCRKLVLLDVCHAGMAANPVRGLTPGGKGPTILASCEGTEVSIEDPGLGHGLFTAALLEALGGARHQYANEGWLTCRPILEPVHFGTDP